MNAIQQDLSAIADGFEEIDQILLDIRGWHPSRMIDEAEVVSALEELIRSGFASAFELSATGPATKVKFEPTRVRELYVYITSEGKHALATYVSITLFRNYPITQ